MAQPLAATVRPDVFKVTTNGALTTLASFYPAGPQGALTVVPMGIFYALLLWRRQWSWNCVQSDARWPLTTLVSFGTTMERVPTRH